MQTEGQEMITTWNTNRVECLRPIVDEWVASCNGSLFGIQVHSDNLLAALFDLCFDTDSDLFVLEQKGVPVGFIGVRKEKSPLGGQMICNEHFWYVMESVRGTGSVRLLQAAEFWAERNGCSHFIMNASFLASDKHDRVCEHYMRRGMMKFETAYIKEVT
jgi:GNAT superfamily N-acetyltransferase